MGEWLEGFFACLFVISGIAVIMYGINASYNHDTSICNKYQPDNMNMAKLTRLISTSYYIIECQYSNNTNYISKYVYVDTDKNNFNYLLR